MARDWQTVLRELLEPQMPPSLPLLLVALTLGLIPVLVPKLWHLARHVITIFHEGGHALMSILMGERRQRIRLNFDTSGVTQSQVLANRPLRQLRGVLVAGSGYTATAVLGLVMAYLLAGGYTGIAGLGLLVMLGAILLLVRNVWGWLTVLGTILLLLLSLWFLPIVLQPLLMVFIAVFFLFGALRTAWEQRLHRLRQPRGMQDTSDAAQIAQLLHLPVALPIWAFLIFDAICGACALLLLVQAAAAG